MTRITISILFSACILCGFSYLIMFSVDRGIMTRLGDLTMKLTSNYLIGGWNQVDRLLLTCYPLIVALVFILSGKKNVKGYVTRMIWTFLILWALLIGALFIALSAWPSLEREFTLLPKYIRIQPFTFYWSFFICLGILGSICFILLNRKKESSSNEIIDP